MDPELLSTLDEREFRAGFDRSVFARVQGWYDVHLESRGAPDVATLSAVRNEPGGFARYAVHRYAQRLLALSTSSPRR